MSGVISTHIENVLASLQRTLEMAANYGDKDLQNVKIYSDLAKKICDIEMRDAKTVKVLEASKEANTIREFTEAYTIGMNKAPKKNTSTRYNSFLAEAKSLLNKEPTMEAGGSNMQTDGDVILDNFISDLDPITKKRMVHPVKNKKCGHHYEKSSVINLIAINPHSRCPVAGCRDKTLIKKDDLVEDPVFMRLLKEKQNQTDDEDD